MRRTAIVVGLLVLGFAPGVNAQGQDPPAPEPPAGVPAAPPPEGEQPDPDQPVQPPAAEPPPAVPPPTTPPTPPAETTPAPAGPGVIPPSPSPELDLGGAPPEPEEPPPPERTLGIQIGAGLTTRLGGDTSGIPDDEPVDLAFGGGVWFAPNRLWSIGLAYQRLGLGGGKTPGDEQTVSVQRNVDTVWAGGRAYPLRSDTVGLYVALALGASWQHVDASGSRDTTISGTPPRSYACSASDGPGFALGAGVGIDVDIERNLAFLAQLEASGLRLTSEPIGGCALGSGSVTGVGAQVGFMYRFDLDEPSARQARTNAQVR